MRLRHASFCLACLLATGWPAVARAGMPSPLPTPDALERVLQLNGSVLDRLQALSFFLLVFLGCAAAVQGLWNVFRRDFPRLPRLTFGRALAGVLLWSLLFVVVLTMISGARELMTPGAWQKQGFTYKLAPASTPAAEPDSTAVRKQQIERLRQALWHFAATHNGRFPSSNETSEIPADVWLVPEAGGLRYQYAPGLSASQPAALLAWEPELDPRRRFVLRTNGDLTTLSTAEIQALTTPETKP
jgi:hypothetical protein